MGKITPHKPYILFHKSMLTMYRKNTEDIFFCFIFYLRISENYYSQLYGKIKNYSKIKTTKLNSHKTDW